MPTFFILLLFSISVSVSTSTESDQCQLLRSLRNNLTYDSSVSTKLVRWNDSMDCCQWSGVECDSSNRVSGLDLSGESISAGINDASSVLFNLVFLRSLDLAQNSFDSVDIPTGFGKLAELRYLNLSGSGFTGQIPSDFSNLTRLVVLDLSGLYSSIRLENPNFEALIPKFTRLRELYLDGVNISANGYDWCNALSSSVVNLRVLSMSSCYLTGSLDSSLLKLQSLSVLRLDSNTMSSSFPEFLGDFPKLRVLIMSSCDLSGAVPAKLFQIESLETIDLSNNRELGGYLPEFPLNRSLQTLQLQYTQFSGNLSTSISNLQMLSYFDLRACNFTGEIPNSIKKLNHLTYLDLSINQFLGSVPSFALLRNLTVINLRANRLSGEIHDSIWEGLENLSFLDLSVNSLRGKVPTSLFSLPSLQSLYLNNNSFSGSIEAPKHVSLSLGSLDLSINKLEGPLPRFLYELKNLSGLVLYSNKFNGSVELTDFWKLTDLDSLDLSDNNLSVSVNENVSLSALFPRLGSLMLASCKLQKFPPLRNQSSLMMLDLSNNQLQGEIPNWLWDVSDGLLRFLNLSRNQFTHLQEPYRLRGLDFLDLHANMLSGQIPILPASLVLIDLSDNNFSTSLPADIGNSFVRVRLFSIANNRIFGMIPPSLCNATEFQVLDLSNNSLTGRIPSCLFEKAKGVVNLGRNSLTGDIPDTFPVGCGLETLDLGRNVLQGKVPRSLERCSELEVLNLGYNKLDDNFPCWLKNLTRLRVLVLRGNKFHGNIRCLNDNTSWSDLQIIDIASNNFSGALPENLFPMLKSLANIAQFDQLRFVYAPISGVYYQDSVSATFRGQQFELDRILTIFTSIDFSGNHFQGGLPETIGSVRSLYNLNLSRNALSGQIPASFANLRSLESLDLSWNDLEGEIPSQLTGLTFLSYLNLSNNHLTGRIPQERQFLTFTEDSFLGNEGLCGLPLNVTCRASRRSSPQGQSAEGDDETGEHGVYISAALGFIVGISVIFGPLLLSERWRKWYDGFVNRVVFWASGDQNRNQNW